MLHFQAENSRITEVIEVERNIQNQDTEIKKTENNNESIPKTQPRRIPTRRLVLNLIVKITAIAAVVCLALIFVLGIRINYGNNMHPAIDDGELVVSLKLQRPYLNAAVMYSHDGKKRVGRVVGLPGNIIEINDYGQLMVNGMVASEDIYYPTYRPEQSGIEYPYTVEEGRAFILNDYREDMNDSRAFGTVDMTEIDGPIIFSFRRRGF